jgi:hypothetical protein
MSEKTEVRSVSKPFNVLEETDKELSERVFPIVVTGNRSKLDCPWTFLIRQGEHFISHFPRAYLDARCDGLTECGYSGKIDAELARSQAEHLTRMFYDYRFMILKERHGSVHDAFLTFEAFSTGDAAHALLAQHLGKKPVDLKPKIDYLIAYRRLFLEVSYEGYVIVPIWSSYASREKVQAAA